MALTEQVFFSNKDYFQTHFSSNQLGQLTAEIFALVSEGIFVLDSQLNYISVSEQFLRITRLPRDEILGKLFSFHPINFYPAYHFNAFSDIRDKLINLEPVDEILSFENRGGKPILGHIQVRPLKLDDFLVYIGTIVDVNERHDIRHEIEHLLKYDRLTHLPTLPRFIDSLQIAIQVSELNKDANRQLLIVRLNIDKLHSFNQSIGIHATNQLLSLFVQRINLLTLPKDCRVNCFSRFGGSSFAILLEVDDLDSAKQYLKQLNELCEVPFFINDIQPIYIQVAMGVSLYPKDAIVAETLIIQADSALKQARSMNGTEIVWFEASQHHRLFQDTHLSSAFNKALQDAQIVPFFQPKLFFAHPQQAKFEALVRWQHPILGTLSPQDFLEEVIDGMAQKLFEQVITMSVAQVASWKRLGYLVKICINIDVRQLNNERFVSVVFDLLDKYPCLAEHIEFEITEIARLVNKPRAIETLQKLSNIGMTFAIDDFGTGYSSLSYLAEYPISLIKIDKLFIKNILNEPKKQTLVKSIIKLAHDLDIKVIAEGVETLEQKNFLQSAGCDGIQGFIYGKPMSAEDASIWLEQNFVKDESIALDFNHRYPQETSRNS